MYFAEFIMNHKERVFEIAKENAKADSNAFNLYDEWQQSEKEEDIINFY